MSIQLYNPGDTVQFKNNFLEIYSLLSNQINTQVYKVLLDSNDHVLKIDLIEDLDYEQIKNERDVHLELNLYNFIVGRIKYNYNHNDPGDIAIYPAALMPYLGIPLDKIVINNEQKLFDNILFNLNYIHTKYIHNDIKPGNILVNNDNPTIIDFGYASKDGISVGLTPTFGSPYRQLFDANSPLILKYKTKQIIEYEYRNPDFIFYYNNTKKDDYISLVYSFMSILGFELPWEKYKDLYEDIKQIDFTFINVYKKRSPENIDKFLNNKNLNMSEKIWKYMIDYRLDTSLIRKPYSRKISRRLNIYIDEPEIFPENNKDIYENIKTYYIRAISKFVYTPKYLPNYLLQFIDKFIGYSNIFNVDVNKVIKDQNFTYLGSPSVWYR